MTTIFPRIILILIGAVSILMGLGLWFGMEKLIADMGLQTAGVVGRASIRADVAGLFFGIGIMTFMAGYRQSRMWALGALVLTVSALSGRFVSVLLDGAIDKSWPPIIVEAVVIAALLWARSAWRKA